ncbi:MaoC family dehydratase N-terminal domain-containing protein [Steroidobacter sp. S1-65]|uniref:MaoC family dehydratase N-terminal domain-containing protein n=1 Tax=Steroidobacter gossypii TaxID=2805490 RepID=A0ABS1WXM5_9GAMM|nr:MaoC/PaaZ C-terminal domain-containing protein [Steroidobacter gossypii]MBM0105723.1 MaoC family dehydratase N-terminal domain-containing protein [Steroidobacter gossypii]
MPIDYAKLKSMQFEPIRHTYTRRDTMLYALGLGVGASDPTDAGDLKYVYEKSLVALPTQAVTLGVAPMLLAQPELGINFKLLLHAEQTLQIHKPLPIEGTVIGESSIDEIYDKGAAKGAILYMTRKLFDAGSGDLLSTLGNVAFLRGDGGFGGKSEGAPKPRAVPADHDADQAVPLTNMPNQALIYRLSGDYNPLHSDPEIAAVAGFERPILHGLCHYGMAGRALIRALCGDDPSRLLRLDTRFTSPVYPGEPLQVEIWNIAAGDASFRVVASERNAIVQDFGRCEYRL